MNDFWNERYAQEAYAYGIAPNEFFKEQLSKLKPGKILFPAEGEGRNAVFAATEGWEVVAFDSSTEAKNKALKLAAKNNVTIDYRISSIEEFDFEANSFDTLVLIYVHTQNRKENHRKLLHFLKPGGLLILESFSKNQILNNSGGPRNVEMLFSKSELESDFSTLMYMNIWEENIQLTEGEFHNGIASVIRIIGKR